MGEEDVAEGRAGGGDGGQQAVGVGAGVDEGGGGGIGSDKKIGVGGKRAGGDGLIVHNKGSEAQTGAGARKERESSMRMKMRGTARRPPGQTRMEGEKENGGAPGGAPPW